MAREARLTFPTEPGASQMPLEVIGAGFGRTGTLSLKRALEELGLGPTYHMEEVIRNPSHIRRWLLYARTNTIDWDTVFANFRSGVDFPVSCVWAELAARYPDAKVVLTVRDPQAWWESTASTIYRVRTMFPRWLVRLVPITGWYIEMTDRLVWTGIFGGRFQDRKHAIEVFERHVAEVISTCPPDRLLVFDVADGWEPLCAFLGVPVPHRPFPRLNDASAMRRRIAAVRWGTRAVPAIGTAAAGAFALRRRPNRRCEVDADRRTDLTSGGLGT